MKLIAGLCVLVACSGYLVRADDDGADSTAEISASAASAANATSASGDSDDAVTATTTSAAAAAVTESDDGTSSAVATVAVTSSTSAGYDEAEATSTATANATALATDDSATTCTNATSSSEYDDDSKDNETPIGFLHENRTICICKLSYKPVCGSNGVTYSNECVMNCVSKDEVLHNRPPIVVVNKGECRPTPCNCPYINKPVCGSNNETFNNDCYLACDNERRIKAGLPPVTLAYSGVCTDEVCRCTDSVIPVCGTNGKTYRNICVLQCYSRINERIGLPPICKSSEGPCKIEKCNCPLKKNELCGSDDNTYYNYCGFVCQNRKLHQLGLDALTVQYPGECKRCICPFIADPVCASDGRTYGNKCLLSCENEKRKRRGQPDLTLRWQGPCNCGCTWEWKPVCISDEKTWPNWCQVKCENKKRALFGLSPLTVLYGGECQECYCDFCPNVPKPVCGSDRKTYLNICFLKCKSDCRVKYGLPPISKVSDKTCQC